MTRSPWATAGVRRPRGGVDPAILVVDDYREVIRVMRQMLGRLGFWDVDDAVDGLSALGRLRERRYDLVICDWNMQPMTGLQLLEEVRGDHRLMALPFIMVTGSSAADQVGAAIRAGVTDYVVKPFTADTLQRKIVAVLGDAPRR